MKRLLTCTLGLLTKKKKKFFNFSWVIEKNVPFLEKFFGYDLSGAQVAFFPNFSQFVIEF